MRRFITFSLSVILLINGYGQSDKGYDISVSISGLRDSSLFLAYHFGDRQYLSDTLKLDARGSGQFTGKESLPQGIYMIVLPNNKYFEILMSDDQHFDISLTYDDYINTLQFKGSQENAYFISYQKKWVELQQESASINRRLQASRQNNDSVKVLTSMQKEHEKLMKEYLGRVIDDNKGNLLSVLVKSMMPVEIPDFIVPEGPVNRDSLLWSLRYNYNKDHFFDNINLNDDRILRTPILHARLESYFKNVLIQAPDSINRAIDRLIKKSQGNHSVFQYVSVYLFNHFRESEIMGHDAVIVKLADDIYLSGKADWVNQEFRDNLKKQVELLRNNLIGMIAKDLVMESFTGMHVALHDIEKDFVIVYFWEPGCGHCAESTPKLRDFINKQKDYSVQVFSVCTTSDREAWTKYINDNSLTGWINGWDPLRRTNYDFYYNVQSTPMIYILDRNKKIIAKKLSVEDIHGFIDNYRKYSR
ncbi:MAG TPA: thioredoxin-like domain-containing protein [Bacteroidales bacterium]|nr:thioredoxin-like domain-containing protein [Bacteroidales bacterium]HPJ58620.1 thioredoxin-like domain-containing protein [Bacteroidales bacterium]HPR11221.1 thioredoxin-like domain-containing protein [Bacteroidales bacterium]HRW85495.1 thioredoxin-like domain-containing protein [Bacteroidales bacterium]